MGTHPDDCCLSGRGTISDMGGLMRLLETTNGMNPSHVFGKPSHTLPAPVLAEFAPEEIAALGAPVEPEPIGVSRERFLETVKGVSYMRACYFGLDLLQRLGLINEFFRIVI